MTGRLLAASGSERYVPSEIIAWPRSNPATALIRREKKEQYKMTDESPVVPPQSEVAPQPQAPIPAAASDKKPTISYDDFVKLDLRVGKVLEVANHPNADKLLVLNVDLGGEVRQIVAGLRQYVAPETLLGRNIVVVANLEPRKMRGLESQGMLLAASHVEGADRKVVILTTDTPVPAGSSVS